jgi:hypothetical protein
MATSGFANWTKDEDRKEFTPCGPHGSCPLVAGFRRRLINCDVPRAFQMAAHLC